MSVLDILDRGQASEYSKPTCARGRVVKPLPASEHDSLHVSLEGWPDSHAYEVPAGNWASRGFTLPALGATCVVIFDHLGDAWAPEWDGLTSLPDDEAEVTSFNERVGAVVLEASDVLATGVDLAAIANANATAGDVPMNDHKLRDMADGLVSDDAATVGQMNTAISSAIGVAAGVLLVGVGDPTSGVGSNGQFYLDTAQLHLWGPKASGAWPVAPIGRLLPTGAATWAELQNG